ncbi:MAG: MarC family protein [Methylotenera sp.]|uniref:MarC family protein n=1 Tax=Methylotenera sp. TaxID=2051956 RepID=UPI002487E768|nr:MarC family protein [Methylotenera sp.]MDI1310089.1 MarC family protein [Methylotenera sp.]
MDWAYLFKIGIALFAIVNPIGSVPIFISATDGWNRKDKLRTANVVAITVFLVLLTSALFGDGILAFFSITIPSFQVGGGILILLIAINMLHAKQSHSKQTPEEAKTLEERDVIAIVPLSIPLLAGPGAIGSMIIASQQSKTFFGHLSLVIPIFVVVILIWLTLQLSSYIADKLGTIGINIVTRLMGLILAAMAVEFIAHGLTGLFPALGNMH